MGQSYATPEIGASEIARRGRWRDPVRAPSAGRARDEPGPAPTSVRGPDSLGRGRNGPERDRRRAGRPGQRLAGALR